MIGVVRYWGCRYRGLGGGLIRMITLHSYRRDRGVTVGKRRWRCMRYCREGKGISDNGSNEALELPMQGIERRVDYNDDAALLLEGSRDYGRKG